MNTIGRGRLYLIAHIGALLPGDNKGGRGKKTGKDGLPVFSKPTLSAYRKVTAHREKIDAHFAERGLVAGPRPATC